MGSRPAVATALLILSMFLVGCASLVERGKLPEVVAALPLAPGDTLAALHDLYRDGLIDMNRLKSSAFLTPEGYDVIDHERKQGNR